MEADYLEEAELFGAIARSGARVLLIGRRALVALGLPVLTADYDLWAHIDDLTMLNEALAPLGLYPNHAPPEARTRGRYVLENGEKVDVLVARQVATVDGTPVKFDEVWSRRQELPLGNIWFALPSLDDLILTKQWGGRDKDVADIRLLEALKQAGLGR